ncbi:hypothetical protein MNBD_NITROSPINAE05-1298 [hydrothermal vent metagenome]|uniref:Uncharacterized protein n=1 Tax=hydrothermal vent metagenome TaxID=652676 RepID=A0A3B1CVD0_9ZZZZ
MTQVLAEQDRPTELFTVSATP